MQLQLFRLFFLANIKFCSNQIAKGLARFLKLHLLHIRLTKKKGPRNSLKFKLD